MWKNWSNFNDFKEVKRKIKLKAHLCYKKIMTPTD